MKRYIVRLTGEERKQLEGIVKKGKNTAYRVKHAHILLKADVEGENLTDEEIAKAVHCHRNTVYNVRQRLVEHGLEAALERKKRDAPPVAGMLDGEKEARLIAIGCSQPPEGCARWTLKLLAERLVELGIVESISYETVRRALKKTN
jgi:transposase